MLGAGPVEVRPEADDDGVGPGQESVQESVALVVVVITSTFDDLPRVYFDLSTKWGGSWHGFLAASLASHDLYSEPSGLSLNEPKK